MRIMWVATKPPWPPVDGGRLLLAETLAALAARGVDVTLVAPCPPGVRSELTARLAGVCTPHLVPMRPPGGVRAAARALDVRLPLAIARHRVGGVGREVARLLAPRRFDVVQAEQLQALPQCDAAREAGIPVLLRAQNVESDLWTGRAALHALLAPAFHREARRLAAWEGAAVRGATATLALSAQDAGRLDTLAGGAASVRCIPAPFARDDLPSGHPVSGAPAVVLFGSRGWFPNQHGAVWFVRHVWPRVAARLPRAVLHVFGLDVRRGGPRIVHHGPPVDSRDGFPHGAILAVPLRVASGVRMKILEAWARGVPVVATPEAAVGLRTEPGRELLVADDAEGFAAAIEALHADPRRAADLTAAGRAVLARDHRPDAFADRLLGVYAGLA